ncbi:hypothetical protein AMAG_07898 [Allomyces macrogynus ATCC 38327]|uniref:Ubiquitin-like-conjugating enzyme ATG10 n=1 Tax=Allomyces macrogynus (strain ATCC 38327) TaxID=578462 RepID=A0A0L0SJW8_ALLM3|nr:hypothetical protein AMAG_07898 [Allomyces macrogynus ATCC 38327]|eukprot:KNE62710.1 hypothetical protein AMAG_07898 [Allomyces macrogynus ATCC 38327]
MTSTVITAAEYAAAARRVAELTRDADGAAGGTAWTLHDADATRPDRVYLTARRISPAPAANVGAGLECVDDDLTFQADEVDVSDNEPARPASSWLQWEIHVVYHATYACPALYFRGSALDGRVLDEVAAVQALEYMRAASHLAAPVSTAMGPFASAVAAGPHPALGTPFLYLHPCQTHDLLAPILGPPGFTARVLLAWLSTVGAVFGGLVSTAQWTAVKG